MLPRIALGDVGDLLVAAKRARQLVDIVRISVESMSITISRLLRRARLALKRDVHVAGARDLDELLAQPERGLSSLSIEITISTS
jgi:hypothetical protein